MFLDIPEVPNWGYFWKIFFPIWSHWLLSNDRYAISSLWITTNQHQQQQHITSHHATTTNAKWGLKNFYGRRTDLSFEHNDINDKRVRARGTKR